MLGAAGTSSGEAAAAAAAVGLQVLDLPELTLGAARGGSGGGAGGFAAARSTSEGSTGSGVLRVGVPAPPRQRLASGDSGGKTPSASGGRATPKVTVLAPGANPTGGVGMALPDGPGDPSAHASALRSQWEAAGGVVVADMRGGTNAAST
jgi:hypothetical protein